MGCLAGNRRKRLFALRLRHVVAIAGRARAALATRVQAVVVEDAMASSALLALFAGKT